MRKEPLQERMTHQQLKELHGKLEDLERGLTVTMRSLEADQSSLRQLITELEDKGGV